MPRLSRSCAALRCLARVHAWVDAFVLACRQTAAVKQLTLVISEAVERWTAGGPQVALWSESPCGTAGATGSGDTRTVHTNKDG